MNFQYDKSFEHLQSILKAKIPVKEAWNKIIDFHEQIIPKPYWPELRKPDIEAEQAEIKEWLEELAENYPLPESVEAVWIGIFKADENGEEVPTIYLIGSDNYNDENISWAEKPSYLPGERYVHPGVLQEIDDIIKTDKDNYDFLDWLLPLAYCTLTFDEIVRDKLEKKFIPKGKKKLAFSTGHESGDYLNISCLE